MFPSTEEFSERVKKTFGNLSATVSQRTPENPTCLSDSDPLWSMTGAEIEKREWRRDHDTSGRDNNPCSSSFDGDDDDDDEGENKRVGLDCWDLRSSIGLDSTLDNEEEEDAYDKVAIGRENAGDRLYMNVNANNNVTLNDLPLDIESLSPDIRNIQRDLRANHLAARIRLREDDALAGDGNKVNLILKRKEHESTTSIPTKRVRFDPEHISEDDASLIADVMASRLGRCQCWAKLYAYNLTQKGNSSTDC